MEAEILQRLYDSEINAGVAWFWDEGFDFSLSDPHVNADIAVETFKKFNDGVFWLANTAAKHYPQSTFAKWWNERNAN